MTLVAKKTYQRPGMLLVCGDEIKPGLLDQATIDALLDAGVLVEVSSRLSYFALLHSFSGVGDVKYASTSHPFPELAIP
jgi:hypothetical protein